MSKRTRSEKIKAKLRTLKKQGITISRAQLEKQQGQMTTHERRTKQAKEEGTTVAAIRRETEFEWTPENKLEWMEKHRTFPLTKEFKKALVKGNRASTVMFSRIVGGYEDSNKDYLTSIGRELAGTNFSQTEWSALSVLHPLVGEFEKKACMKVGPRSIYRAKEYKDILLTWKEVEFVQMTDLLITAFKAVNYAFPYVERWDITDLNDVLRSLDRDKSAGYPWFAKKIEVISAVEREKYGLPKLEEKYKDLATKKLMTFFTNRGITLDENESVVTKVMRRLQLMAEGHLPRVVNFQGLRTEAAKFTDKNPYKQRLVWGVPYDQTIVEKLLCGKLQEEVLSGPSEFGTHYWGALEHTSNGGEKRVLGLIKKAEKWGTDCISIDFTKFDQHITAPIMKAAIEIFKSHSALTHTEEEYLVYALLDSELWTSWGVLERHNGVPSGSFFTNLLDSTINAAFNEAVGQHLDCQVDYVVNGDDCCMVLEKDVDTEQLVQVGKMFGMEMNSGKQWRQSAAFSFDQEVFSHELGGSSPMLHRVLNSIMRHDQRKEILQDLDEVAALYSQLRRIKRHPYKEIFLEWLLENTDKGSTLSRFDPSNYQGANLPGVERYNAEPEEKLLHPITVYENDWFWDLVSCT